MENEELTVLNIINEKGEEEEIRVILYFSFENDDRNYIIYNYTNNSEEYYASEIEELEDEIILKKIESSEIIKEINEIIGELKNEEN